jgi:YtkA-like
MRPVIVAALLLALLTAAGCGGKKKQSVFERVGKCPSPISTASAGNAEISAQALGGRYAKLIVVHAKEKSNGTPLRNGQVTIQAEMTCPHAMGPFYMKSLKETSAGTYRGRYSLFMPGHWDVHITVRTKGGDATTSGLPVVVKAPG